MTKLPFGHKWLDSGQDRGEILVDVWTCGGCGLGYQRAVATDPDTPDELREWEAILLPGTEVWDDTFAEIPLCK